jgi:DNA gyrase subunit B
LLLTLFFRHFRPIVEGGFIYIAQPPLYKIKRGKEVHYVYSDQEKNELLGADADKIEIKDEAEDAAQEEDEAEGNEVSPEIAKKRESKVSIQRYKGLGEMNPEELSETTMKPENRVLKQVRVEDAADADRIFDILMGDDVPSRKSFIQSNAKTATLDI